MTGPWRDGASGGTPITAAELNDIQAEVDKVGPIGESVDALADLVNTGRLSDEALAGSYAPVSLADDVGTKADKAPVAATAANTQRLLSKLQRGTEDACYLYLSDSTGNENTEHIYLEMLALAAQFPAYTVIYNLWDVPVGDGLSGTAYLAPVTIQTGTGAQTLRVYNVAIPGTSPAHLLSTRWAAAISAVPAPDLIFVSHGHNMGTVDTLNQQFGVRNMLLAFTEEITAEFPNAGLVLMSQNPTFTAGREKWQSIKARLWQEVAAQRGYGFIDVHEAFRATGNPSAYVDVDLIHPTKSGSTNGSLLWANTVIAAMKYDARASVTVQRASALTEGVRNLIVNGDFAAWDSAAPDGWTAVNATITKDTTNFETGSYGLRVQGGDASGSSHIEYVGNPSTLGIKGLVSGQFVTAKARVRVPAGAVGSVALTLLDQVGSAGQARNDMPSASVDRFVWLFVTKQMTAPTTSITVRLAARVTGTTGGDITVDRIELVAGTLPYAGLSGSPGAKGNKGDTGSPSAGQYDLLGTYGDHPALYAFGASAGAGVLAANQANLVRIKPHRNVTIAQLTWMVHTTGGNYDIGIYALDGTRLWSKGSTATPAAGVVQETVSPAVSLVAGTEYYAAWAADGTAQLARGGLSAGNGEMLRSLTGLPFVVAAASAFPLPATITPGASPGVRVPAIIFRES